MNPISPGGVVPALVLLTLAASPVLARDLSFEDRVHAQMALERVYYSHQIGATLPFEEALPRTIHEEKVRTYLKHGVALERFWNVSVTAELLAKETERIQRQTRMPERLGDLYAALGNDPMLVQECLARPILVSRLVRNFFCGDREIQAAARGRAEALRAQLADGSLDPRFEHPRRTLIEVRRREPGDEGGDHLDPAEVGGDHRSVPVKVRLAAEAFDRWAADLPSRNDEVGPLVEERDRFIVQTVLERAPARILVARFVVTKEGWEEWWRRVEGRLDAGAVKAVASDDGKLLPPARSRNEISGVLGDATSGASGSSSAYPCSSTDVWDNGSLGDPTPDQRRDHTAIWTGSVMVVWGGGGFFSNTGGRYDPATDTWTPTSTVNAPSARILHTAVWTGREMIIWGGYPHSSSGGRYDPETDRWTPTSTTSAPSGRVFHTAVWTGSRMVVWGGARGVGDFGDGGRYDPSSDTWAPISPTGAPSPREEHAAVWTGSEMIVWGGYSAGVYLDTGARYDPVADTWAAISTAGAPSGRRRHTSVWTGRVLVVWGGFEGRYPMLDTGGRYDPETDTWTATSTANSPSPRQKQTAVWTGRRMLIWGGYANGHFSYSDTGGSYDPTTDTWVLLQKANAPSGRVFHAAVWTGSQMIVWGGYDGFTDVNTGGRYDPGTDTWTPTAGSYGPEGRFDHTAIWTGNLIVVWGGWPDSDTGDRYDPATDSWIPTTRINAPEGRALHTAVWTGSRMIVWGGMNGTRPVDGLGRYDPVRDRWEPSRAGNAPAGRFYHSAVWTGRLMVVWGGFGGSVLNTGGRYDPASDTWSSMSTVNAPTARELATAVWTGTRVLVWGGLGGVLALNTGGLYDPDSDSWSPTSTSGAPAGRGVHSAVWTGSAMIVWGGLTGSVPPYANSGGRYDPQADSWQSISTADAPSARFRHTTIWTGHAMVVWGGEGPTTTLLDTGGRYDPTADSWTPVSTVNAPSPREFHSAVWTGSQMIIWGGYNGTYLRSGGRYCTAP